MNSIQIFSFFYAALIFLLVFVSTQKVNKEKPNRDKGLVLKSLILYILKY